MFSSPNMGLTVWNLLSDPYDHNQLADNFAKLDRHDHSGGRGTQIPTDGLADFSVTKAKLGHNALQFSYDEVLTEETTASTTYTNLTTIGPSVTVTVDDPRSLIRFVALIEAKNTGANATTVGVHEPTIAPNATEIYQPTTSSTSYVYIGGIHQIVSPNLYTTGTYTFTLKYKVAAGTGSFRNRKLWVGVA